MLRNSVLTKYRPLCVYWVIMIITDVAALVKPRVWPHDVGVCGDGEGRRGQPQQLHQPSHPLLTCSVLSRLQSLSAETWETLNLISCSTDKQEQILYYLRDSTNYIDIPIALPIAYGRCSITEEVFCLFNCVHNVTIKPLLYNDRKWMVTPFVLPFSFSVEPSQIVVYTKYFKVYSLIFCMFVANV